MSGSWLFSQRNLVTFNISIHHSQRSSRTHQPLFTYERESPTFVPVISLAKTMLIRLLVLLAAVAPYTFADVQFTSPSAGAQEAGGSTLKVAWKESGTGS